MIDHIIPSVITQHMPTVWLVLHTLLAAALVYSCACRFARTSKHRTRAGIRWAFNALVIYAGTALFAPWACGWQPDGMDVLAVAAITWVQIATAVYWHDGVPLPYRTRSELAKLEEEAR